MNSEQGPSGGNHGLESVGGSERFIPEGRLADVFPPDRDENEGGHAYIHTEEVKPMQQFYVTAEVSRLTGYSIDQLNRAHRAGLPEPARAGCHRIYTLDDIERVKAYFAR